MDRGIKSAARPLKMASAIWPAALAGAVLACGGADAQSVSGVTVTAKQRLEVRSPKYTAPVEDTPQTVTVVDAQLIQQQNLLGLRDVLTTVPGITFGAGEGGGGYGDSITLRGYSANADITVDGVRDSAQYTRSDPFNLDQIEVVNGANSVYGGAGSVGGTINLATKRPTGRNNITGTVAAGSDNYARATLDANHVFGDFAAFRLNAMAHQSDVPGRDVEENKRWGVAPSLTLGVNGPTQFTLLYAHQHDDNIPQYGVPYALNAFSSGPLPGVDSSDYFGYSNVDKQDSTADSFTAIIDHTFNDNMSVRNLTRWQKVSQVSWADPPQGAFCLASGINPYSGAACTPLNTYQPSGPRGVSRDTTNDVLINQTDLRWQVQTGGLAHTLVVGGSFSNETYHLNNGNFERNPLGALPNPVLPMMTLSNPNPLYTGPVNLIVTGYTDNAVKNRAIYAFDRIEVGKYWELNGGVRVERNEGHGTTATLTLPYPAPPASPVITMAPPSSNSDDLTSYRAGIVFKPAEQASIYFAYGNALTPSQSTVNGACTVTSATGAANCNVDPEEAQSYEIGGKWNAIGSRLLLTAALFRNERTNFRVASGDPTIPQQQLDGASRVDGVALGATGAITGQLTVFANYTYLDSQVLQSISDISIAGRTIDIQKGDPLANTPMHSFSMWATYQPVQRVTLGYGATYSGRYTFTRFNAASPLFYTPDYWTHRAMASYAINRNIALQVNVNNLFDEKYYTRIRNNATSGWATPGDARNASVSLNYRF